MGRRRPAKWRERQVRVDLGLGVVVQRRVVEPGRPGDDLAELRRLRPTHARPRRPRLVVVHIVASGDRRAMMRRRREVARPGRREGRGGGIVVGRLAAVVVERRHGGEGEGHGGGRGGGSVVIAVVVLVKKRGLRLHLQGVLEAHDHQLHARVLLLVMRRRRRRRRRLAPAAPVRGHRGGVALLLVAGVLAQVRDVEHAQVGVRALHLLRGRAPLRGAVRAPIVTSAKISVIRNYK